MTIAGPRIRAADRLEHEQWAPELAGPLDRPVQGEVPARSPVRRHPVEDVVALGGGGLLPENSYSLVWHGLVSHHRSLMDNILTSA